MSSKAIKEKPDLAPAGSWATPEVAPSTVAADEPSLPRWVGLFGLTAFTIGVVAYIFHAIGWSARIGTDWGSILGALGLCGLLFHAVRDGDQQVRRTYGLFAVVWLVLAGIFTLVSALGFLPWGSFFLLIGLAFVTAFLRNETEEVVKLRATMALGAIGGGLALAGLYGAFFNLGFFMPYGLVLALVGLGYLWAFLAFLDPASDFRQQAGTAVAVAGLLLLVYGLARSLVPFFSDLMQFTGGGTDRFFQTAGLLEIYVGVLYLGMALGVCSDAQIVVMTRRELVGFFYSPIAYIVLLGFAVAGLVQYVIFVFGVMERGREGIMEPVVGSFIVSWILALCVVLVVPILTMRLFSEEKRAATFEVLLTAPVRDLPIVLSKFLAALIFYMVVWLPIGLLLLGFRIDGGKPFDYQPMVGFSLGLICTGANFLAMGLFFSSLTRNQIVAAGLTAVGMLMQIGFLFGAGILRGVLRQQQPNPDQFLVMAAGLLEHVSYLNLWITTMNGKLPVQDLLLHASAAVFWLFLTLKVLEVRKWS